MSVVRWFLVSVVLVGCVEQGSAPEPLETRGLAASPHYAGVPGEGVVLMDYGTQNSRSMQGMSPVLADIVDHLPSSYGDTYYDSDPITWGHETSHGIHAHLRNNFNDTGQRANGFYMPGGKAAFVVEPGIRKSNVAEFVPASLRGTRYSLYVTGSQSWDDTPLYIWDEWNAYINGGEVGTDMVDRGLWNRGWRDGVAGQLEFTVYAIALAMAVRQYDPAYFESNTRFKEFLAFNTKRAMDVYRRGAVMADFAWDDQDSYLDAFENSPDAEGLRQFARELFGEDWANHVLFDVPLPQPDPEPTPMPDAQPSPEPTPEPTPEPDPQPGPQPVPQPDGGQDGWADGDGQSDDGLGDAPPVAQDSLTCQSAPGTPVRGLPWGVLMLLGAVGLWRIRRGDPIPMPLRQPLDVISGLRRP